jgi:hypothetical protein
MPVLSCENGAAVIEVNANERQQLHIVFLGEEMLLKMRDAGIASPVFGDRTYVIRGQHAELRQVSPTVTRPISLGGIFYPQDFRKMIVDVGSSPWLDRREPRD